ncbi:MAG: hypothetical protein A2Z65_13640 [Gallionellales bacterium RIFCSPLOWO2_02_58_13]|nr:MAG: hypothetical protein A2Z65_13640 [Gallionellales bacterium RIFCSPLOWO2_02_58_13]
MQKFQDITTGQEWHFDAGVDIAALQNVPATLSANIIPKPDEYHDWNGGGWVPNAARRDAANNKRINAEIVVLEEKQIRPTRELLLDAANSFAKNKLAGLDAQISALRAQLVA